MDQKKIGMLLKRLRKEKKLTQGQLAERFQVSDDDFDLQGLFLL